jgi:hypothetical protein
MRKLPCRVRAGLAALTIPKDRFSEIQKFLAVDELLGNKGTYFIRTNAVFQVHSACFATKV